MLERIINPMLGLIMPGYGTAARATSPSRIALPGAGRFPQLCMLPVDVEPDELGELHTAGRRVVQLKADGIRALYLAGQIAGRDGAPLDCALHCQPALARLEEAFGTRMVFDGEYVEQDGFNATVAAHRRGEGQGVFWLFDALPYDDWCAGGSKVGTVDRLSELRRHVMAAQSPFVGMLDFWLMDAAQTRAKALELFREGYEGIVTKDAEAGYVRARSRLWRRCKARMRSDLPVIDIMVKEGKLRGLLLRGPGDKPLRIGPGWNADTAARIIDNHAAGRTSIVRIRYELTVGVTRSVRGAVFLGLIGETVS